MPELPEVETTRRGIEPYILHQQISHIEVFQPKLRWPIPEALHTICHQEINQVGRRGKYLFLKSTAGSIIIHLGMSGSLRICDTTTERRLHDHVQFYLNDDRLLRYHDPRRFGCVLWTPLAPLEHHLLAKLGPEPLSDIFDGTHLFKLSRKRKITVKSLIMDSHIVVGVGNIYASEALFSAGIRPGKSASSISSRNYDRLAEEIKKILIKAIAQGGTTLKDFVNSDGNPGYFAQQLCVYGRKKEPCKRCKSLIKCKTIAQRASYYCPQCQS